MTVRTTTRIRSIALAIIIAAAPFALDAPVRAEQAQGSCANIPDTSGFDTGSICRGFGACTDGNGNVHYPTYNR